MSAVRRRPPAILFAKGTVIFSAKVAALTEGMVKVMFMSKLNFATAVLVAFVVFGAGAAALMQPVLADKPSDQAVQSKQLLGDKKEKTAQKSKTDKELLQGTWLIVALELDTGDNTPDGRTIPEEVKKDGLRFTFIGDKCSWTFERDQTKGDRTKEEMNYKIDPDKKPKALDFTYADDEGGEVTVVGIYKVDGDTLTICQASTLNNTKRPTEFSAEQGSERRLLTFKREKDAKKAQEKKGRGMSLEQVKAKLKEQRDKINSLYVEYDIKPKMLIDDPKLLARWSYLAVQDYSRTDHIAFKGPKRYLRQLTHRAEKIIPPQVDPDAPKDYQEFQQKAVDVYEKFPQFNKQPVPESDNTHAFNGKAAWNYAVIDGKPLSGGRYTVSDPKKARHAGNFQSEYLVNIGLHLPAATTPKEVNEGRRKAELLPDMLEFSNYRVAEKTERIDGFECLVLEASELKPGTSDKLWLDLDHGLAVRKFEMHREGVLAERFINSKLKEMAPGIWLPQECKWQRAAPHWAKKHRGEPVLEYQMTLLKGSVNDVRDDLFELPKDAKTIDRR